jgi:hypothetical protein
MGHRTSFMAHLVPLDLVTQRVLDALVSNLNTQRAFGNRVHHVSNAHYTNTIIRREREMLGLLKVLPREPYKLTWNLMWHFFN